LIDASDTLQKLTYWSTNSQYKIKTSI